MIPGIKLERGVTCISPESFTLPTSTILFLIRSALSRISSNSIIGKVREANAIGIFSSISVFPARTDAIDGV